jgi:serine/threonine protein kinase
MSIDINDDAGEGVLGHGAFGTVYKLTYYGTPLAIKVVGKRIAGDWKISPEAKGKFMEECKVMRKYNHPNIVQYMTTEVAIIDGVIFPALVMELMEMSLLCFLTEEQELPNHKAINIALQVARALTYLHKKWDIVHGDLHIGNVLVTHCTANEGPLVKVSDFGLARAVSKIPEDCKSYGEQNSPTSNSLSRAFDVVGIPQDVTSQVPKPASSKSPDLKEIENYNFGKIMWSIHTGKTLRAGTTVDKNLQEMNKCPLRPIVHQCWNGEQSAKDLLTALERVKEDYPDQDPTKKLKCSLEEQDKLLKGQMDTINSQNERIERKRGKIRDLKRENMEKSEKIKDLEEQIKALQT